MKLQQKHRSDFTIYQFKKELLKSIELSICISLETCWFWSETGMFFPNPEWLPSKLIIKQQITWIKNVAI